MDLRFTMELTAPIPAGTAAAGDFFAARLVSPLRDAKQKVLARGGHVQIEKARDVLMHLFVHQIHHRGQVHAMLAGTPVAPPQLDEFFLREELSLRENELKELDLPLE